VIVKVRSVTLFGEVWGIGPATALKLYEKGHRTLDDLRNEDSLTTSQRLGLKYFDDIKKRIPRNEVQLAVSMHFCYDSCLYMCYLLQMQLLALCGFVV